MTKAKTAVPRASVAQLTILRGRLLLLRDDILDRLVQEIGAGELDLLAATAAALIATDERLGEMGGGDPGRQ